MTSTNAQVTESQDWEMTIRMASSITIPKTLPAKKFYFLEYFYVLLKSIERFSDEERVFDSFKILKQEHGLGESKYKKLTSDGDNLSQTQLNRYRYTFEQVINEAKEYGLVQKNNGNLVLTEEGKDLLLLHQNRGLISFNRSILGLMESKYGAFRYLITFLYNANKHKSGLFVLPNYSPRKLDFQRNKIKTTSDVFEYARVLASKLEQDIQNFIGESRDLEDENKKILDRLVDSDLLPASQNSEFDPKKYNAITLRFRDFWRTYFLREIYKSEYSLSAFDVWTYRGKQIGIIHATEFYPNFKGGIVYPTSVILDSVNSRDFQKLYTYPDGFGLYMHKPVGEENREKFVDYLVNAYFDLCRSNRSYFINLLALRELVCYNMRISEYLFGVFLETIYKLNLVGNLQIRISLEVDRLPEETSAMYLKREPVMVDGKYRNIIAIDVTKGGK